MALPLQIPRLLKKSHAARGVLFALLVLVASGGQCLNTIFPPSTITISATPTGCGTKVSDTRTINWLVKFTVEGADPGQTAVWSFSDGTSGVGQTVVKAFDTAALESGPGGDHQPVNFDVTVTSGSESVTKTFGIPMRGTPDGDPDPSGDTCVSDEGGTHAPVGTDLCYIANPPASGPHCCTAGATAPVAPGFYDEALATERWVHNLEHGTVVLLYDCGGDCSDNIKDLGALFDAVPESPRFGEKKMVITRYAGIPATCPGTPTFPASGQYMAIAWNVQRAFDTLDTDGILAFYARHVDHGPEDVPIPAP